MFLRNNVNMLLRSSVILSYDLRFMIYELRWKFVVKQISSLMLLLIIHLYLGLRAPDSGLRTLITNH